MASIRRELTLDAPPAAVWEALRDVGAIHTRLAPGFVLATELEPGGAARIVTFGNGTTRCVWIADLLPHELAPTIAAMIDQGLAAIATSFRRVET